MLDRKQRAMVMDLFGSGVSVSEIAREVGVSRQSIYRVIQSDFKEDAEIHALKKRLKKAELRKKIREAEKPPRTGNKLGRVESAVDGLISNVLALRFEHRDEFGDVVKCVYCGKKLEYVERIDEKKGEILAQGYRCNRCGKIFVYP